MPVNTSSVIQITSEDGKAIYVEASKSSVPKTLLEHSSKADGVLPGHQPTSESKRIRHSLDELEDLIEGCCNSVRKATEPLSDWKKIGVELGIKFVGEAGIPVLTKASAEANLKVTIEWER